MVFKCINCKWEGEVLSEEPLENKCPICGDEVISDGVKQEEVKVIVPEKSDIKWTYSKLKELTKSEQVDMLKELNFEGIYKLRTEKQRIKALLSALGDE